MSAIKRDVFVYLEPKTDKKHDFAQCGSCRLFAPKSGRCVILGPAFPVTKNDSCALYIPGAPINATPERSMTPQESGFVAHRVQCHRCRFAEKDATHCGLFAEMNRKLSEFSLDTKIKPTGCCNAHMPREASHKSDPVSTALNIAKRTAK